MQAADSKHESKHSFVEDQARGRSPNDSHAAELGMSKFSRGLGTGEAAKMFHAGLDELRKLIADGRLLAHKQRDGRWLIDFESLKYWNAQRRQPVILSSGISIEEAFDLAAIEAYKAYNESKDPGVRFAASSAANRIRALASEH